MILNGFFLGLSNGVTCIATCAPVLIPCLLAEGKGIIRNYGITGWFLLGRLLGYSLFAVVAWALNSAMLQNPAPRHWIIGMAYVLFSGLLIFHGFFKDKKASCNATCHSNSGRDPRILLPGVLPVAAGLTTGLSFCPPFLLAFSEAASQTSLLATWLYFFSFFLGTSLLFVLAPFTGMFKGFPVLRIIGQTAAGLMGFYYLYSGIILITGGLYTSWIQ
jgi:hypothetical protein